MTGSIASVKGFPSFGVYNASKAAVRSFARTWTVDLKGRNIRVGEAGLLRLHDPPQHEGTARRDRLGRALPRVERLQLRHWHRTVRRWGRCTDMNARRPGPPFTCFPK